MTPLLKGRDKGPVVVSADALRAHASALEDALASGDAQLPPEDVRQARAVLDKVAARTRHTGAHTVVALAGATGSGKSLLFNALVGTDVARTGARRPITSTPTAAVWGASPAGELLDWLGVGSRHQVPSDGATALDGLVLLDLPDFDSREQANRLEAERVLEFVDVFVWITDPQKYADARLHDDYVAVMRHYDAVTLIVLNQADRLTPQQLAECKADLERLVQRDGLANARVLTTSATTGAGVSELRGRLADAVAGANAARARLDADVRTSADRLRTAVADRENPVADRATSALTDALARACGIPAVVDAVANDYRRNTVSAAGWPFTRWVARLRPDPLKRLRLDPGPGPAITEADIRGFRGRTSLPRATPAARAAVDLAARRLADAAAECLPRRWAEAVAAAALPPQDLLADELDQAIIRTPLRERNPFWWQGLRVAQWLFAITAVVGLAWTLVQVFLGTGGLIQLPSVYVGPVALPLVLLVGGLLLGWLLALLARWFAGIGARRRAAAVDRRLRAAVSGVAEGLILGPVQDVLDRHRTTRTHLDAARASGR